MENEKKSTKKKKNISIRIMIIIIVLLVILGYACFQVVSISKILPIVGTYYCGSDLQKTYNSSNYETKIIITKDKSYSIEEIEKGTYTLDSLDDNPISGGIVYYLTLTSSKKKKTKYELFIDNDKKSSGYKNLKTNAFILCTKES